MTLTDYVFFSRLSTRYGWTKALCNGALFGAALTALYRMRPEGEGNAWRGIMASMGISFVLGMDFGGITGMLKDEPLLILYKLGLGRLGTITIHPMERPDLKQEKCIGGGSCYDVCPRGVFRMG
ncbi:MAG: ferredoxin family protein [Actinomycetota bacterium]|nr:ferredoxin family protein [Actinomycetota bacterium]